jgi:hypothetical protein
VSDQTITFLVRAQLRRACQPRELELEPTVAGRLARWMKRARILLASVEAARADHASVDLGFTLVERDSVIGGGLLARALAYRLALLTSAMSR